MLFFRGIVSQAASGWQGMKPEDGFPLAASLIFMGFSGGGSNPRRQQLSPTGAATEDLGSGGKPFGGGGKRKR